MTPETSPSPFDPAISELETRIRHMQMTLETLKQLRQGEGGGSLAAIVPPRPTETEVQHDTFFGMTIADAVRKYLTMTKATRSTADIAAALEHGGLKHSSTNFPNNVRAIIGQRGEDFIRVPNGDWGLSEWYPGLGRGRKPKPEKPAKGKSTHRRRAAKGPRPRLEDRIIEVMKTKPNEEWGSSEIASVLGSQRESVQSTLSRLAKEGKRISKAEKGYRLVKLGIAA